MINNFRKRLKDRNVTVKDCHLANFLGGLVEPWRNFENPSYLLNFWQKSC